MSETDGPVKSKEVQHAEKIYATLRECREQVGMKKIKGKHVSISQSNIQLIKLRHTLLTMRPAIFKND